MRFAADLEPLRRPVTDLTLLPDNPRRGVVEEIAKSLQRFGQRKPIVVDEHGVIVAGNHTYQAAIHLGWSEIAASDSSDLTPAELRAYALADNQLSDLASYDPVELHQQLEAGYAENPELMEAAGFSSRDLDRLAAEAQWALDPPEEEPERIISVPTDPVTRPGDVIQMGPHRLVCGDARDPATWDLLETDSIAVAVTSPPYAQQRSYDESSGFRPIPPAEYVEWFAPVSANVADHLAADGSWFVNIKPSIEPGGLDTELYVLDLVLAHAREWGWHFATEFCWQRNGVPKSVTQRFKNQFEPVYQFTRGRWKMRPDNVRHATRSALTPFGAGVGNTAWDGTGDLPGQGVGRGLPQETSKRKKGMKATLSKGQGHYVEPGEYIGPGLAYPGNRLPTFAGSHQALGHAAAFPVGLPQFFIEAYSDPGDATVDPFAGTGSSLMAAHNTGRIGLAIELSPAYCDVIITRWENATGQKANRVRP